MSGWDALGDELGRWRDSGRTATLWWRDDDAGAATPALRRLLTTARAAQVPLAVAAVPDWLTAEAAALILDTPRARVLQHGGDHTNRAPPGAKKCEFPPGAADALARLAAGALRLRAQLGARALPVLVPPWNRIDPDLVPRLPAAGFRGLSTYRARGPAVAGLAVVNTHVDIVDWHGGRRFVGEATALDLLCRHLAARRGGLADGAEPTGLLTHHAAHDAAAWSFIDHLMDWVRTKATVSWCDAERLFDSPA